MEMMDFLLFGAGILILTILIIFVLRKTIWHKKTYQKKSSSSFQEVESVPKASI